MVHKKQEGIDEEDSQLRPRSYPRSEAPPQLKFYQFLFLTRNAAELVLSRYLAPTSGGRYQFGPAFYAWASSSLFLWIWLYMAWFFLPDGLRMEAHPPMDALWIDACIRAPTFGILSGQWFTTCIFPQVVTAWVIVVILFTVLYVLGLAQVNAETKLLPSLIMPSRVKLRAVDFPIILLWALSYHVLLLTFCLIMILTVLYLLGYYSSGSYEEIVNGLAGFFAFLLPGLGMVWSLYNATDGISGNPRYAVAVLGTFAFSSILFALPLYAIIVLWYSWVEYNYTNVLGFIAGMENATGVVKPPTNTADHHSVGQQLAWFVSSLLLPVAFFVYLGRYYKVVMKDELKAIDELGSDEVV